MVYFVRKYSSAKWRCVDSLGKDNVDSLGKDNLDLIPSDTYTSCLRTNNNKLSIWKISCDDNNELNKELEEIVLAMVTSFDTIRNAEFVYFSEDDISELKKTESKGNAITPIEYLANRHEDLEVPTIKDLKKLARVYINSIKNNQTKRFNRQQILKIVDKAINNKLLTKENSSLIKNMEIIEKLGLIECCNECGNKIDLRKKINQNI